MNKKEKAMKFVQFLRSLTLEPVPIRSIYTYTFSEVESESTIQEGIRTGRYEVVAVNVYDSTVILACV
jgi:hypothetical protein